MAKKNEPATKDERPVRGNTGTRIEKQSPAFVSLYVNDVNVMMTPWDFRLRMGQLDAVNQERTEATVTVLADVRLSPQHMKRLVYVLTKQLEIYEGAVGPIALPEVSD